MINIPDDFHKWKAEDKIRWIEEKEEELENVRKKEKRKQFQQTI